MWAGTMQGLVDLFNQRLAINQFDVLALSVLLSASLAPEAYKPKSGSRRQKSYKL